MSSYYNLQVKDIIRESEDAITIVFDKAGHPISYKPGQFLTLIIPVEGEKLRRSYSLCSAPGIDQDLAVTVKKVAGGKVSNHLFGTLKKGDFIEVMHPMGTFTIETDYHKKRDIILIGAGSGITPLMSILKSVLANEPLSNVYLIFGNRNESSIIFKESLNELKKQHGDRFTIVHVLSQPLSKLTLPVGRINRSELIKILETFPKISFTSADYFLCGPEGMMDEARKALEVLKVPANKIHKESFLSSGSQQSSGEVVESKEITTQEVTIVYQGTEYKITVPPEKSILQTALDADIDLPYSCQSGMCTACMGKCVNGKVKMDESDGLSDREISQGFVLICVGHPASSGVVIEVD
ncbi:MAG: 2Fe-2S iron-sulfur cluster-binding protein [Cytophagaceae bacterium]